MESLGTGVRGELCFGILFGFFYSFSENSFIAGKLLFGHNVREILAKLVYALLDTFHSRLGRWLILAKDILDAGIGFCLVLGGCITGCLYFWAVVGYLLGHLLGETRVTRQRLLVEWLKLGAEGMYSGSPVFSLSRR